MSPRLEAWFNRFLTVGMHAGCLLVLWVGASWPAVLVAFALYVLRGFGITGGYHRYFAHRSFKTSRPFQAFLGMLGASAMQGGPITWPRWHRHHHQESDQPEDLHSPFHPNFWHAHMGWFLTAEPKTVSANVRDLEKCWELVWIERLQLVIIGGLAASMVLLGRWLGSEWGTSGLQMLTWGFFISTVVTWHITWCVNSVAHIWGSRRFETTDQSKNNWLLGIFALGEGHHNNHHAHQGYCRQGLLWWEIDVTYYALKALSWVGVVWDLNEPEPEVFVIIKSLEKIRAELENRAVAANVISERLMRCQVELAGPAQSNMRLRVKLEKDRTAGLMTVNEQELKLRAATLSFAEAVQKVEAAALA